MSTTTLNDNRIALQEMVLRWERRLRFQRTLVWLPRAALPGLAVGVALAAVARLRPLLMPETIAALTLALMAVGMLIALAVIWLRPRPLLASARRFDVLFGLNERVSTALELLDGRIHTTDELAGRQMEDARLTAREVRARDRLPLRAERRDGLLLAALGIALALLLLLPNAQSDALAEQTAQTAAERAAVEDAAETVRDLTEQVAADPSLTDEQRRDLLQVLDDSARSLSDPEVSPEEAFAAMSGVQNAFQQASELLERQLADTAAALQEASDALRDIAPPGENEANLSDLENLMRQLEAMRERAEHMGSETPQPGMGESLARGADALGGDPSATMQQAGQSLRQASDDLSTGNGAQAQQSIGDAQDALQSAGDQQAQQQQAQQSLSDAAAEAGQAASQINQAQQPGSQGESPNPQGEQSQPNEGGGESQGEDGQSPQSGQGQEGQQQGQDGNAQQSQNGQSQGQGQQGQGQSSEMAQGNNPGALSGTALQSEGAGAGDNPGGESESSPSQGSIDAQNNPDGVGEGTFDPVYAPEVIGGEQGGDQIILEQDNENAPVVEGEFSANPSGQATVPYNLVFRQFAAAASRSLNSGSVPLALRDVVRQYFLSLEPAGQ